MISLLYAVNLAAAEFLAEIKKEACGDKAAYEAEVDGMIRYFHDTGDRLSELIWKARRDEIWNNNQLS